MLRSFSEFPHLSEMLGSKFYARPQGVLVRNILAAEQDLRRAGADAAQAAGGEEEAGGTGIILKRLGEPLWTFLARFFVCLWYGCCAGHLCGR